MIFGVYELLLMLLKFRVTACEMVQSRIVDATRAKIGQFPFMVALLKGNMRKLHCSGSLVTRLHVLTAAHCYIDVPAQKLGYGIAGDICFGKSPGAIATTRQVQAIKRAAIHPKAKKNYKIFGESDAMYDFAVLELYKPMTLTVNVALIPLSSWILEEHNRCLCIGFGVYNKSDPPKDLRWDYFHISKTACPYAMYYTAVYCVVKMQRGLYFGDSGGPLIDDTLNPKQYGVMSAFIKDQALPWGNIYANVAVELKWIKMVTTKIGSKSKSSW